MAKYFNTIPDMICSLAFLIFYFYWLYKGDKLTNIGSEKINKNEKLHGGLNIKLSAKNS